MESQQVGVRSEGVTRHFEHSLTCECSSGRGGAEGEGRPEEGAPPDEPERDAERNGR